MMDKFKKYLDKKINEASKYSKKSDAYKTVGNITETIENMVRCVEYGDGTTDMDGQVQCAKEIYEKFIEPLEQEIKLLRSPSSPSHG